jgi:hypothetical protein
LDDNDSDLILKAKAGLTGSDAESRHALAILIVKVKDALVAEQKVTTDLTERMRKLNVWLLWVTIALGALTVVQILSAVKVIGR